MTVAESMTGFDVREIQKILPHRYPFLLVDRMLSIENGVRGQGIKNVTINEPFFQGHYPGKPIMPGVMIVEALAQVGAIVLMNGQREKRLTPYLAGIDTLRFRRPVVPGDQLLLEVELTVSRGDVGKMKTKATVDGQVVVQGEMMFALKEEKDA
ncbi:MAG TPA: 3-hydroxyacyl-ACP dehydratase FabZ [Candidatus Xenobia bacterium]|jgi:3-hydroxyacyl-[acyl-carrier-protein] dehydratase